MISTGCPIRAIFAGATFAVAMSVGAAAYAGDCNADIAGLTQKRQAMIEKLNSLSKASKGKLDPVASCPTLRSLVKAEGDLLKYLEANKNWCNIPDDAVAGLKANGAKSQAFATQACNMATQMKKQQQQQATASSSLGETQKLPAGPL